MYSFLYGDNQEKSAVKGFTLNYENSALLNQDSFSKITRKQLKQIKVINDRKLTRKKNKEVVSEYHEKIFKLGYDKRVVKKD